MTINIAQWNSRSIKSNKGDLQQYMYEHNIHIALISETWLKNDQWFNIAGYNIIRKDRHDGYGGVAILLKKSFHYENIAFNQLTPEIEYIGINIYITNNTKLNTYVLYKRPQATIDTPTWISFFDSLKGPFLLGGDFNSHHTSWGSSFSDRNGSNLLEAIDEEHLVLLNDGSPTRLSAPGQSLSAVDMTICSATLAPHFTWFKTDDTLGSDHYVIKIAAALPGCNQNTVTSSATSRWNLKQADWKVFHDKMESLTSVTTTNNDLTYNNFMTNITSACNESIPKTKKSQHKSFNKSWWTDECKTAINNRKQVMITFKNNPNMSNFLSYKQATAIVKRTILKCKRASWREYCMNLNKNTPIKDIWQEIKKIKHCQTQSIVSIPCTNILTSFLDKLAPPFAVNAPEVADLDPIEDSSSYVTKSISMKELELAMKSSNNSSPGIDQIHYAMLSHLPFNAKHALLTLYNDTLHNESPPEEWKKYKIVPILKPGKNALLPSSYRPISLASCMLKTFERIIKNRIIWWMQENDKWPKSQFGFRKFYSTNDAILTLTTDIQIAFSNNESVLAAFLDIKGAYDSVQLDILSKKLKEISMPTKMIRLIHSLYKDRKIFLYTSDQIIGQQTSNIGLPQGTIMSPLLYVIFTKELEAVIPENVKILQYADDICVYVKDKSIEKCTQLINEALINISKWMTLNGLDISYEKTNISIFTRSFINFPSHITLNNIEIKHCTTNKFLGIHLDSRLTFKKHIREVTDKTEKSINILRMISSLRWGADPEISLLFYRACIRSVFDYGCLAYGSATDSLLKKLDVVHNKCLRLCTGLMRDTPLNALLSEAGEYPLFLRRQKLATSFILNSYRKSSSLINKLQTLFILDMTSRFWTVKKSPLLVTTLYSLNDKRYEISHAEKENVLHLKYVEIIAKYNCFYYNGDINISHSCNEKKFRDYIETFFGDHQLIFTDGSLRNGNVGCAWFEPKSGHSKIIKLNNCSVYTSELIAILEAIKHIEEIGLPNNYLIISDSKSAVDQIRNLSFSSSINPIIAKIIQRLHSIRAKIDFLWVRGHTGIKGNETVDELAKQGGRQEFINNETTTITDILTSQKRNIEKEFINYFRTYGKGKFYTSIQKNPCTKHWYSTFQNKSKYFIKNISRLRTNHGLCPVYLYKINQAPSQNCQCNEIGSLEHLIMECTAFTVQRNKFFESITSQIENPFSYKTILSSRNEHLYLKLQSYLTECNINV